MTLFRCLPTLFRCLRALFRLLPLCFGYYASVSVNRLCFGYSSHLKSVQDGGRRGLLKLSSDQMFELECGVCKTDGVILQAVGFCVTCDEYVCEQCIDDHMKIKALRKHAILQGEDLQRQHGSKQTERTTDFCSVHPDHSIAFYCTIHEECICLQCKVTKHLLCKEVKGIADICRNVNVQQQATKAEKEIKALLDTLKDIQKTNEKGVENLSKQKDECLLKIGKLRNDINKVLDKLESDIHRQIIQTVETESCKINERLTSLEIFINDLETEMKDIDSARSLGDDQLFVVMKKMRMGKMRPSVDHLQQDTYSVELELKVDDLLTDELTHLKQLGVFNVIHTRAGLRLERVVGTIDILDKPYKTMKKYKITGNTETEKRCITGMLVLPDGKLLLCEQNKSILKLTDTYWQVQYSLRLDSQPWDIASISDQEVIVTLPYKKKLQYVTIKQQLQLGKQLECGQALLWSRISQQQTVCYIY